MYDGNITEKTIPMHTGPEVVKKRILDFTLKSSVKRFGQIFAQTNNNRFFKSYFDPKSAKNPKKTKNLKSGPVCVQ